MTEQNELGTVVEVDAATGEVNERPLTATEIVELEQIDAHLKSLKAEAEAKASARANALDKIAKITGLTEKEIEAL